MVLKVSLPFLYSNDLLQLFELGIQLVEVLLFLSLSSTFQLLIEFILVLDVYSGFYDLSQLLDLSQV